MTNFYQVNAQSGDHMICWLIEKITIIDHHGNNQSINQLNHNQFIGLTPLKITGQFLRTNLFQLQKSSFLLMLINLVTVKFTGGQRVLS